MPDYIIDGNGLYQELPAPDAKEQPVPEVLEEPLLEELPAE